MLNSRQTLFNFSLCVCGCLLVFATKISGQSFLRQLFVTDEAGAPVVSAKLIVQTSHGAVLREGFTAANGTASIADLPAGSYRLTVAASGFQTRELHLTITPDETTELRITLSPALLRSEITVTAQRGAIENTDDSAMVVAVKNQSAFRERPLATIGNALESVPGALVQQSTYAQVSPFLRGLTGYQVLNLIDGVRFNNATFRSGPNQYLAFVEPSQAERIEALLGPTGAQYGSDALGGTIHLLTQAPAFSADRRFDFHGDAQLFAASADASGGGNLNVNFGTEKFALLLGGSWKRHNDLRAGRGYDSHHVFHRFFGLNGEQIKNIVGARQQDTGFAQSGWHAKLAARFNHEQNLTLRYQHSGLNGVRGYKDLWGGLGRLRSEFAPQELDFFYARYEKLSLGWLDSLTGTLSINSQRDGSVRQNLRATDRITTDDNRVNVFGYAAQATKHFQQRHALVFGGEIYRENIRASRVEFDPTNNLSLQRRALFPNGSRYTTLGLFAQHSAELFQNRLRAVIGGRFTHINFRTFAERNRTTTGASLGVIDAAQSFQDVTWNAGLTWRLNSAFKVHALAGRGFRAPNLNDLGALGLNDLGYEIPAAEAVSAGGLIGISDGETALSSGKPVSGLKAESLFNYELGLTLQQRRVYARVQAFDAELKDPIVRRTLLFPVTSVPASLAGLAITPIAQTNEQHAQNVVTVATRFDPRAVKAFVNDGASKYSGIEAMLCYTLSPRWSFESNYSFIAGRELHPNRFIRRLPPQQGAFALRYQPAWKAAWIELGSELVGAQRRLSGGDLTDERIGAARRRRDITDFFNGSLVRPFLTAGTDGVVGTGDDRFAPTNETLAQIRDRVLPIGATVNGVRISDDNSRAPLFLKTPGYATLHLRGGVRLAENLSLNFAVMNLLDKNYRVHGSGVDAPGLNVYAGLRFTF